MYKLTNFGTVIRLQDSASIPPDPNNGGYVEFVAWVAAGNTPDPADPEPPVPVTLQIEALEQRNALALQRTTREVLLQLMEKEAATAGLTPAQLRQVNSGYRRVKQLDEQIAALRSLL